VLLERDVMTGMVVSLLVKVTKMVTTIIPKTMEFAATCPAKIAMMITHSFPAGFSVANTTLIEAISDAY